jgi:hypothetical protein
MKRARKNKKRNKKLNGRCFPAFRGKLNRIPQSTQMGVREGKAFILAGIGEAP